MVSLAKRLEGKPFHLIATHRQNNPRDEVVAYLKKNKLSPGTPNFTATKGGSHPKVKGGGHVPYYMVFDHHGDLAHHHMCGAYHGGDGLKMIEWVDKLLADAPDVYFGRAPFEALPGLAGRIAARKGMATAVKEAETKLAGEPSEVEREELDRILRGVTTYRDRALERADGLLATRPSAVRPLVDGLAADLKDTEVGRPVAERAAALRTSDDLKAAIAIEKTLAKTSASLEKRKGCKPCKKRGLRTVQLTCAQCRSANKAAIGKARKKLTAAIEGKDDLPISETVRTYLGSMPE